MIFEFKKAKNTLLIGALVGIIVIALLFVFTNQAFVMLLFVFLYPWMLYRYSKRVAVRSMQDLEALLYRHGDVKKYLSEYQRLIENKKSKDKRWQLQKHHNAMVAAMVLNDQSLYDKYNHAAETQFSDLYKLLPVFNYFRHVLNAMSQKVFEKKYSPRAMLDAFKHLEKQVQAQILRNPNSFHNWVINDSDGNQENPPFVIGQLNKNRKINTLS